MEQDLIKKIFKAYETERKTDFNLNEFSTLIATFPAIVIIAADGKFQKEEKNFLMQIAKNISETFIDEGYEKEEIELLSYRFYAEFDYLYWNKEKWYNDFTNLLANYLHLFPKDRKEIALILSEAAETSKNIMKDSELNKIKELKEILGIK